MARNALKEAPTIPVVQQRHGSFKPFLYVNYPARQQQTLQSRPGEMTTSAVPNASLSPSRLQNLQSLSEETPSFIPVPFVNILPRYLQTVQPGPGGTTAVTARPNPSILNHNNPDLEVVEEYTGEDDQEILEEDIGEEEAVVTVAQKAGGARKNSTMTPIPATKGKKGKPKGTKKQPARGDTPEQRAINMRTNAKRWATKIATMEKHGSPRYKINEMKEKARISAEKSRIEDAKKRLEEAKEREQMAPVPMSDAGKMEEASSVENEGEFCEKQKRRQLRPSSSDSFMREEEHKILFKVIPGYLAPQPKKRKIEDIISAPTFHDSNAYEDVEQYQEVLPVSRYDPRDTAVQPIVEQRQPPEPLSGATQVPRAIQSQMNNRVEVMPLSAKRLPISMEDSSSRSRGLENFPTHHQDSLRAMGLNWKPKASVNEPFAASGTQSTALLPKSVLGALLTSQPSPDTELQVTGPHASLKSQVQTQQKQMKTDDTISTHTFPDPSIYDDIEAYQEAPTTVSRSEDPKNTTVQRIECEGGQPSEYEHVTLSETSQLLEYQHLEEKPILSIVGRPPILMKPIGETQGVEDVPAGSQDSLRAVELDRKPLASVNGALTPSGNEVTAQLAKSVSGVQYGPSTSQSSLVSEPKTQQKKPSLEDIVRKLSTNLQSNQFQVFSVPESPMAGPKVLAVLETEPLLESGSVAADSYSVADPQAPQSSNAVSKAFQTQQKKRSLEDIVWVLSNNLQYNQCQTSVPESPMAQSAYEHKAPTVLEAKPLIETGFEAPESLTCQDLCAGEPQVPALQSTKSIPNPTVVAEQIRPLKPIAKPATNDVTANPFPNTAFEALLNSQALPVVESPQVPSFLPSPVVATATQLQGNPRDYRQVVQSFSSYLQSNPRLAATDQRPSPSASGIPLTSQMSSVVGPSQVSSSVPHSIHPMATQIQGSPVDYGQEIQDPSSFLQICPRAEPPDQGSSPFYSSGDPLNRQIAPVVRPPQVPLLIPHPIGAIAPHIQGSPTDYGQGVQGSLSFLQSIPQPSAIEQRPSPSYSQLGQTMNPLASQPFPDTPPSPPIKPSYQVNGASSHPESSPLYPPFQFPFSGQPLPPVYPNQPMHCFPLGQPPFQPWPLPTVHMLPDGSYRLFFPGEPLTGGMPVQMPSNLLMSQKYSVLPPAPAFNPTVQPVQHCDIPVPPLQAGSMARTSPTQAQMLPQTVDQPRLASNQTAIQSRILQENQISQVYLASAAPNHMSFRSQANPSQPINPFSNQEPSSLSALQQAQTVNSSRGESGADSGSSSTQSTISSIYNQYVQESELILTGATSYLNEPPDSTNQSSGNTSVPQILEPEPKEPDLILDLAVQRDQLDQLEDEKQSSASTRQLESNVTDKLEASVIPTTSQSQPGRSLSSLETVASAPTVSLEIPLSQRGQTSSVSQALSTNTALNPSEKPASGVFGQYAAKKNPFLSSKNVSFKSFNPASVKQSTAAPVSDSPESTTSNGFESPEEIVPRPAPLPVLVQLPARRAKRAHSPDKRSYNPKKRWKVMHDTENVVQTEQEGQKNESTHGPTSSGLFETASTVQTSHELSPFLEESASSVNLSSSVPGLFQLPFSISALTGLVQQRTIGHLSDETLPPAWSFGIAAQETESSSCLSDPNVQNSLEGTVSAPVVLQGEKESVQFPTEIEPSDSYNSADSASILEPTTSSDDCVEKKNIFGVLFKTYKLCAHHIEQQKKGLNIPTPDFEEMEKTCAEVSKILEEPSTREGPVSEERQMTSSELTKRLEDATREEDEMRRKLKLVRSFYEQVTSTAEPSPRLEPLHSQLFDEKLMSYTTSEPDTFQEFGTLDHAIRPPPPSRILDSLYCGYPVVMQPLPTPVHDQIPVIEPELPQRSMLEVNETLANQEKCQQASQSPTATQISHAEMELFIRSGMDNTQDFDETESLTLSEPDTYQDFEQLPHYDVVPIRPPPLKINQDVMNRGHSSQKQSLLNPIYKQMSAIQPVQRPVFEEREKFVGPDKTQRASDHSDPMRTPLVIEQAETVHPPEPRNAMPLTKISLLQKRRKVVSEPVPDAEVNAKVLEILKDYNKVMKANTVTEEVNLTAVQGTTSELSEKIVDQAAVPIRPPPPKESVLLQTLRAPVTLVQKSDAPDYRDGELLPDPRYMNICPQLIPKPSDGQTETVPLTLTKEKEIVKAAVKKSGTKAVSAPEPVKENVSKMNKLKSLIPPSMKKLFTDLKRGSGQKKEEYRAMLDGTTTTETTANAGNSNKITKSDSTAGSSKKKDHDLRPTSKDKSKKLADSDVLKPGSRESRKALVPKRDESLRMEKKIQANALVPKHLAKKVKTSCCPDKKACLSNKIKEKSLALVSSHKCFQDPGPTLTFTQLGKELIFKTSYVKKRLLELIQTDMYYRLTGKPMVLTNAAPVLKTARPLAIEAPPVKPLVLTVDVDRRILPTKQSVAIPVPKDLPLSLPPIRPCFQENSLPPICPGLNGESKLVAAECMKKGKPTKMYAGLLTKKQKTAVAELKKWKPADLEPIHDHWFSTPIVAPHPKHIVPDIDLKHIVTLNRDGVRHYIHLENMVKEVEFRRQICGVNQTDFATSIVKKNQAAYSMLLHKELRSFERLRNREPYEQILRWLQLPERMRLEALGLVPIAELNLPPVPTPPKVVQVVVQPPEVVVKLQVPEKRGVTADMSKKDEKMFVPYVVSILVRKPPKEWKKKNLKKRIKIFAKALGVDYETLKKIAKKQLNGERMEIL